MDNGIIFPYTWDLDNQNEESTIIRIYGIDKNNESICLTVSDFTPYVYLELPTNIEWNGVRANMLSQKIDSLCGRFKPINKSLMFKKKLYYANINSNKKHILYPFLFLSFVTKADIRKFSYKIKRQILVGGLGNISLKIHEIDASPILQLVCLRNIQTSGWFKFRGKKLVDEDKETYCSKEYLVRWKNLSKYDKELEMARPLILSMDIEVNSTNPNSMPKANKPGDKVFQISCIIARQGDKNYEKYLLTLGEPDNEMVGEDVEIRMYPTESDLLEGYAKFIIEKNPQIIIGYNILGFDIPYMIDRSKTNLCIYNFDQQSCRINHHSSERTIKWSSSAYKNQEFTFLDSEGRLHIDILPLVRRDYKFDNYKLKTISDFFLGETKDPLSPKGIFKCYRIGMEGGRKGSKALGVVGKYCVQDSVLVLKLFDVLETWVGLCEMAKTCNVPIFFLYTQGQQIKVFSQVYKHCMYNNFVVEKDGYVTKENERYTGATVFPPKPGAYDRVVPFDFTSLYPTTIIAHNIDYSTLALDENIPDEDCNIIEWDDHVGCEHDTVERKTKVKEVICAHHYYRFIKSPVGVVPTLLTNLLNARKVTKKEMKEVGNKLENFDGDETEKLSLEKLYVVLDKRQLAYKVSANSMYGAMGVRRGYLPFMPGAMCTTAWGRESLEKAATVIQKKYKGELIYGDTDSTYIHFPKLKTAEECWDYCLHVEKELLNIFPPPMKLAFEEVIYWRFFILTKKRYMALSCGRDGKLSDKITKRGVLLARRDNSKFIRELYKEIIMKIFNRAKEKEVTTLIIDEINKLCSGSYQFKNFIITKSVGEVSEYKIRNLPTDKKKLEKRYKDLGIPLDIPSAQQFQLYKAKSLPSQVQLAEKMRRRGMRVDAGSRLEYVVTNLGGIKGKLFEKIEDPGYQQEYSDLIKLDYIYYLKLAVTPIDQALSVAYKLEKFVENQYKYRIKRYEMLRHIENLFLPKISFE